MYANLSYPADYDVASDKEPHRFAAPLCIIKSAINRQPMGASSRRLQQCPGPLAITVGAAFLGHALAAHSMFCASHLPRFLGEHIREDPRRSRSQ